ncbi:MAG: hypothetical protein V7637_502 [Mycobacteriales bacterium]|jgi:hypothetical protein
MITPRTLTAFALLTSAVGIIIQILGGHDYPVVPPGIVILVAAAGVVWFVPWRGAPVVAILAALFLVVGLFAADQASRLVEVDTVLDTLGLWIQMVAVVVALVTAVIALVHRRPSFSDA